MDLLFLVLALVSSAGARGADPAPTEAEVVLERCLEYHDPRGVWSTRPIEITAEVRLSERLAAERGYAIRTDRVRVDNTSGTFRYESERGADRIEIFGDGDSLRARLNGDAAIGAEQRQRHRLAPEQLAGWRDYLTYIYGLPMKLRDAGTRLDPSVTTTELEGRRVLALRVTYSPEVGSDTWYFYVDPRTYALLGSRFFHDEARRDGEYIVYEGEVEGPEGLRLPKLRHWYTNQDAEYLATDEVSSIE